MTRASPADNQHVVLAVAFDEERGIGRQGTLAWHRPADLRRFRSQTMGLTVIVGRLTLMSLPGPLNGRRLVSIGTKPTHGLHGSTQAADLAEALALAGAGRIVVAGGASVYEAALPTADEILLTRVPGRHGCDRHFPPFEGNGWHLEREEDGEGGLLFETWIRT